MSARGWQAGPVEQVKVSRPLGRALIGMRTRTDCRAFGAFPRPTEYHGEGVDTPERLQGPLESIAVFDFIKDTERA